MKNIFNESGQSLIALLFFMVIGITVISAAAFIVITDIYSSSNSERGIAAYYAAESGVENGILYILSHPTYSGSLTIPDATVIIAYDSVNKISTISSTGINGNSVRKIQAQAAYSNDAFSVFEWKEQ